MQVSAAMVHAFLLKATFAEAQRALEITRDQFEGVRSGKLVVLDGPAGLELAQAKPEEKTKG